MRLKQHKAVICSNEDCMATDQFEPDSHGFHHYQSHGECVHCGAPTVYADSEKPTLQIIEDEND